MRRSDQPIEKQAERENEAHGKPKGKGTTNIATLDNDTMIEAFKYLNYCGLANNSLVSKRFCNVIQTHRHKLALLYVDRIEMECVMMPPTAVKIFGKWLSPAEYIEWNVRNGYSKQVSLDSQIVLSESTHDRKVYYLIGSGNYNGIECEGDEGCKGFLVCEEGRCKDKKCEDPDECDGKLICYKGKCKLMGTDCKKTHQCPGIEVCVHGTCIDQAPNKYIKLSHDGTNTYYPSL